MALLTLSSSAEGPTPSKVQQTLEELRNSNFGSWDEVLKVLRQPLALFGLGVGPRRVKRHSVGGDEPDPTFGRSLGPQLTDEQKACLRPTFLGDVQRVILERIGVDWAFMIEEERWSELLHAWFVAPTRQSETASPFEPILVTTIQLATLSTLSAFLSNPRATQHESTIHALTRIVQMLFSRHAQPYEPASQVGLSNPHAESTAPHTDMPYPLDLCYIHETLRIQPVDGRSFSSSMSPQATLQWAQCVRLLFALPAKISNWSEGQEDWSSMLARPDEARSLQQHDEFGAYLAEQLEQLIGTRTQAESLRVFVSRVLRSGTAAPIPFSNASSGRARRDFWSALLRCVLRRCEILAGPHRSDTYLRPISEEFDMAGLKGGVGDQVALYSARWQILLLRTLQRTESETFFLSLLAWFDVVSCGLGLKRAAPIVQDVPSRGPVLHEEDRDFCSTGKDNLRNAIALVIKIFLGLSGTDKPLQHISDPARRASLTSDLASDSSSSEESSASSDERQGPALPCKRTSRGPASLAPLLIEVVRGTRSARHWSPSLATALASVIQSAGSKVMQRIAKDVLETWSDAKRCEIDLRERELYLTTLLIALPLPSPYDPTFIEGVGAHLSHLDPYIRRLGMLCAELSSHHAAHQQTSDSGDQEAPKTLSFSKSIWEGHGEGREEARVLRKLSAKLREGIESGGPELHLRAPHVSAPEAGRLLGIVFEMRRGCDPLPEPIPDAGQPHMAHSPAQIVSRPKPISRSLPQRVAPASRLQRYDQNSPLGSLLALDSSGTNVRKDSLRRPLIVDLSQTDERDETVSGSPARQDGLRPAPAHEFEEAESSASSSGEDSSASEAGDEERAHLQSTLKGLNLANDADDSTIKAALEAHRSAQKAKETKTSGRTEDEEFGMSVPKKKRRRVPVYVNELPPLLRDQDRSANRLALRHAEALVRRKRGWGGEVEENSAELLYALVALQNNFGIKHFEEMRTNAVVALVVAAPRITAPLLAEQYFNHQYSLAQRSCMLIALATAARDLAGLPALHSLEAANESLIGTAIDRAKTEGEARVPEIQRDKALQVNPTSRGSRSELSVSREERSSQHASSVDNLAKRYPSTLPGAMLAPLTRYLDVAVVYFLRPLIQRHWIALDELLRSASSNSRQSTANSILRSRMSTHGGGSTIARRRAGTGQVLSPSMVSRYLDCLAILAHAARHAVGFARTLVPQLFELALATNTRMLCFSDLELNDKDEVNEQHEAGAPDTRKLHASRRNLTDAREAISASSASLILVLLDACWEMDGGVALMDELSRSTTSSQAGISSAIFADIITWTEALFETEDAKGRRAASFGRSGRCAAAILVRVHEIRSHLGQRM